MLSSNPFSILSETISPFAMQSFIIAMVLLIAVGTIIFMMYHLNNSSNCNQQNHCDNKRLHSKW